VRPEERAARARMALVIGGYEPSKGAGAVVELTADLQAFAEGRGWNWLELVGAARGVLHPPAEAAQRALDREFAQAREPWRSCKKCQLVHPAWAQCQAIDRSTNVVWLVHDGAAARWAAFVEPWYARLPGVLGRMEAQMRAQDERLAAGGPKT
jgi:hypothetical protein